jgi:hypothetical protein
MCVCVYVSMYDSAYVLYIPVMRHFMHKCLRFSAYHVIYTHNSKYSLQQTPQAIEADSRRMLSGATDESVHWTIVFNVFVLMQLFNEFNSRHLQSVDRLRTNWSEWNVFVGITKNPVFITVVITTMVLQVLIIQFAGKTFGLVVGGLTAGQWGVCIGIGAFSLPWQLVINAALLWYTSIVGPEKVVGARSDDESDNDEDEAMGRINDLRKSLGPGRPDSAFVFSKEATETQARMIRAASMQELEVRSPQLSL